MSATVSPCATPSHVFDRVSLLSPLYVTNNGRVKRLVTFRAVSGYHLGMATEPEHRPSYEVEIEGWPGSTFSYAGRSTDDRGFTFAVPWASWLVTGHAVYLDRQLVIDEVSFGVAPNCPIPAGGIGTAELTIPIGRLRADLRQTLFRHFEAWQQDIATGRHEEQVEARQRELELLREENRSRLAARTANIEVLSAKMEALRPGRKPYSDEELRGVARMYLEIQREHGVQRIVERLAALLEQSISTVNKKVRRATEAGFLGPAHQGRGGRMPGALLDEIEA